jgi:hypothetical protein
MVKVYRKAEEYTARAAKQEENCKSAEKMYFCNPILKKPLALKTSCQF